MALESKPLFHPEVLLQQQTQRTLLDWQREEYAIEKPSNQLLAVTELDSDTWVGEVKRMWGKKLPLTTPPRSTLCRSAARAAARALTAETLKLERTLSDLVNRSAASARAWKTMLFIGAGRHARFNGLARSSPKKHIGRPFPLCGLTTNPSERERARMPCPQVVALSSASNFEMSQYL
jgi:hypothetical protein